MNTTNDLDWITGGGEMGALIQSMDWSKNPLGPIKDWPQSLKTAVSLCLSSTFPINIVWGPDHIQIYNDSYRPICGALHPASMGSKFKECWASALPVVGGAFDRAFSGEGTYIPNQRMFLERFGYLEEAFMTFSFSPIRDESGNVGGIFHPISESTEKMLSNRRTQVVRDLAIQINKSKSLKEMYEYAKELESALELDLPFMIFTELNQNTNEYELKSSLGLEAGSSLFHLKNWSLKETKEVTAIKNLESVFGQFKSGPYEKSPDIAVKIPIFSPGSETPIIILMAGASSAREIDSEYSNFFDLLKNTFTTAVTNILAYEEEQKRAEALAQIDRAKTAFFSNVSHEFRTPLTLILGPLEDSLEDQENPLNHTQRQRQEVIHRNSTRLLKLVNSLLDFSRIEAGRMQASYSPVDLSKLTADLSSLFRSTIEKAGLQLEIECNPLPEKIYIDREMWEKIVLNLLSNAFKFTFEGKISVKMSWENSHAILRVSDSGIGVSEEEVPRLFERFHRVQGAKSRTYEGTGIGLALVQELVALHKGLITVETKKDVGTTFTITIPSGIDHLPKDKIEAAFDLQSTAINANAFLQEARQWLGASDFSQEDTSTETSLKEKSSKKVLLADDNADMRDYVFSLLKNRWNIITATDGQNALELALKHKPDLILTDVMMPVLDGFGLLQKIRHDHHIQHTPVIMLSARAGEEAKIEGLSAGADDYLVKPFSAKELISKVEAILNLTERRYQLSKELVQDAKKFRSTFSHASVNIAMVDLQGIIIEINDAFLIKSGFSANEVIGKHFSLITHPEDVEPNLAEISKIVSGLKHFANFDKRYLKKNGSFFWVRTSISTALDDHKKPLYFIAVSQDIEEIKTSQEKYRKAVADLQQEKELREKFVATLTHDLRTPMTSARMSAQLIQRKPEKTENVQNQVVRILNSVNRADQMIQDLLDTNRIRAGEKLPMNIDACNLNNIVTDVIENLITIHGGRFSFEVNDKHIMLNTSSLSITRILDNLINNAIKYGSPESDIHISLKKEHSQVEMAVKNFGNPIALEDQKNIFDQYKRSSAAEASNQKGWGLGLTLVRGLTEALGGNVNVHSNAQDGTTFKVVFPT